MLISKITKLFWKVRGKLPHPIIHVHVQEPTLIGKKRQTHLKIHSISVVLFLFYNEINLRRRNLRNKILTGKRIPDRKFPCISKGPDFKVGNGIWHGRQCPKTRDKIYSAGIFWNDPLHDHILKIRKLVGNSLTHDLNLVGSCRQVTPLLILWSHENFALQNYVCENYGQKFATVFAD